MYERKAYGPDNVQNQEKVAVWIISYEYVPSVFQLFLSYCDHKEVHNGQPAVFGRALTEKGPIGIIRLLELQLQLSDDAIPLLIIAMWAAN